MMRLKKTVLSTLALVCVSTTTFAIDMKILNNTIHDSTCKVNNVSCSEDILGEGGVTPAKDKLLLVHSIIKGACGMNRDACTAKIYMSRHCKGEPVAEVVISVNKGFISARPLPHTGNYTVVGQIDPDKGTLSMIVIDGGPKMGGNFLHWIFG